MVSLKLLLLLVLHFAASTKTEGRDECGHLKSLFLRSILKSLLSTPPAFILNSDVYEENSLLKWKFDKKCLANATVMGQVNEFKAKYGNLRSLRDEMDFLRDRGFKAGFIEICERKRDIARTVSDSIQSLADYCVDNSKIRKEFVLNTLLLLETTLDFICSMNQSHYEAIFELQSERCFAENLILLKTCVMKSFKFYFWEKPPQKLPTLIQLVNGSICK